MITLKDMTKYFYLRGHKKVIAENANVIFPTGASVGLLGRNGAGKSTLLKLMAGTSKPTSGKIIRQGTISYPVGFSGSFHPDLTGTQNTRFIARIYGADTDALVDYVQDFTELGSQFHAPYRSYSSGMRSRLAFGVSMGLKFNTYLIDEITAVGDAAFKRKSRQVFNERMKVAGFVFVSHSDELVRQMCTAGAVIERGEIRYFDDVNEAIELHKYNMQA